MAMTPRGLPRSAAAEYLGCKVSKFDAMVSAGELPKPRMIGAKPIWDRLELDAYFDTLPRKGEIAGNEWDGIGADQAR